MLGPIVLVIVLVFTVWLKYELSKSTSHSKETFLEREQRANNVRRQPTADLDYITFSEKTLPFIKNINENNDEILSKCVEELHILQQCKILNLQGISNTELKMQYGPANLQFLSECDEHFFELCKVLHSYAKRLLEVGLTAEAKTVLEFAVEIGCDTLAVYTTLADCYLAEGDADSLEYLQYKAKACPELSRARIEEYLNTIIQ